MGSIPYRTRTPTRHARHPCAAAPDESRKSQTHPRGSGRAHGEDYFMDASTRARRPGSTGGRPVLAFDIGGTKLAAAVVTADGAARGVVIEPTRREEGWTVVLER